MSSDKSRGIVLQQIRYSDNSLIVKVFTEHFGLQSYLIKGAFQKRSRFRPALFQPMSVIHFVSQQKRRRELHYMQEIGLEVHFHQLHQDMGKNAVVMFMSELLSHAIHSQEPEQDLFDFLLQTLQWLDLTGDSYASFPHYLMLELSRFLGFYPKINSYQPQAVFDMMEGQFKKHQPEHPYYLNETLSEYLHQLALVRPDQLPSLQWNPNLRRQLLVELINYYKLHVPGFNGLKSHEILKVILS
ncbi:MAG: repair protein RecO [Bacteroidales bacterium]|jgi:DNA repair protein RecO (recombination protein O)|nr:repair protein RecO [Bacteroidales bacterium]